MRVAPGMDNYLNYQMSRPLAGDSTSHMDDMYTAMCEVHKVLNDSLQPILKAHSSMFAACEPKQKKLKKVLEASPVVHLKYVSP